MKRLTKSVKQYFKENLGILIGFFTLCVIVALLNNRFLSRGNILNVLRQLFSNCNLALGMCLVIITGGIDLSVGAIMALSGTLCAGTIAAGQLPIPVAILMGLAIGVLVGFINGTITAKMNIAPFIVTMATQQICRGLVYVYADGLPIRCDNPPFNFLGNGYIGEIPITILYSVFFVIVIWLVLSKSQLGRWIYAVGGNKNAARFSGINVDKVLMIVYSISGFLAAFAGIIYCARMYSGQPTIGVEYGTDAIASAVLGGTAFGGGFGTIPGTFIGACIIGVMQNGMNHLAINAYWQQIIKGLLILGAVYFDSIKGKGIFKKKKKAA